MICSWGKAGLCAGFSNRQNMMRQELSCRSLLCRCSQMSPTLCHHHMHRTQLYHCHQLPLVCLWHKPCTRLLDKVFFTPWGPPRLLGDQLSLKAADWYQPSPYPAAGVKQPLSTLCVLSWLLSEGNVIQDILTHPSDLLNSLQHLSYWRTKVFLWGDEQTPPWGPVCTKSQGQTQPWKISSEASPSPSPTLHQQVFPKTLPGGLCQEQAVSWAGRLHTEGAINHRVTVQDVPRHPPRTGEHSDRAVRISVHQPRREPPR